MTHSLKFHTNAGNTSKMKCMEYVCVYTKNCSFTIWFCSLGVEYNLSYRKDILGGYTYTSRTQPLTNHYALIKRYNLADQIKKWNESHS